jgi:hypothetical protein
LHTFGDSHLIWNIDDYIDKHTMSQ